VRVLTLNIFARRSGWPERRAVLVSGISALRPDVIAFQECIVDGTYDQVADLVGSDYEVAHQSIGLLGDGNHGASIASRWPIIEVREVDHRVAERGLDYACGTILADIAVPEPVGAVLFVAHGPWYPWWAEHERERQAVAAARLVEESRAQRDRHVVVAGDFNAPPSASSVRFWAGRQSLEGMSVAYLDVWDAVHPGEKGHTVTPRNPLRSTAGQPMYLARRIDYIFVGCGAHGPTLDVSSCDLAFDEPVDGVWASDHFGLVADLVPAPAPRDPG
jgi:endonuclease/exonuclease/phosphatase family metal-dependent hydrolase